MAFIELKKETVIFAKGWEHYPIMLPMNPHIIFRLPPYYGCSA